MGLKQWLYKLRYPSPYDEMLATLDRIEAVRGSLVPRLERLQDGDGTKADRDDALDEIETIQEAYDSILTEAEEANLSALDNDTRASIGSIRTMAQNQIEVFNAIHTHVDDGRTDELEQDVIDSLKPPE